MKKFNNTTLKTILILIGIVVAMSSLSFGQTQTIEPDKKDQMQTLFGYDSKITGYGSIDSKFTQLNGKDAVIMGAHGGVIFNSYFYFGLGAYGLVTNQQLDGALPNESLKMHMGYTGLMMGFNVMPSKVVHFGIPLFVGVGNIEIERQNVFVENSAFLVFEPALQLEVNVVRFMKVGLGAGYRMVSSSNLQSDITDDDLSYWTGNFSLVFGKFK